MTNYSRRQLLRLVGTGAVASAGLTQTVAAQENPVVEMGNNYFDPIGLYVESGTTVRFDIEAGAHSATAYSDRVPPDGTAFDSGIISQGSFEHTFEKPGTYDYYCIPHETVGMVGRIVVDTPGGPAEDSPFPSGDVPDSDAIVEQGAVSHDAFAGDGGGGTSGGMMGHGMGPGTMQGRGGGWFGWLPLAGGLLGAFGVVGVALYLALGRGNTGSGTNDSAMATLRERYERGEIDEQEFHRRREQLERNE